MEKKILVVEDSEETRELVYELLNMSDYHVYPVTDGYYALDVMENTQPDLIIMDIRMPKRGGVETAREIRKDQRFKNIPIIFISAFDDITPQILSELGGRIDFMKKPLNMDNLLVRIKNFLK
ncbi:MAG: hypothetical protein A2474_00770 [Elusimicrobia bacterium RIFOXYC2_FULL_34_12]|nr:MAG: hypothetical protein A2474_00770 [Elusimicrobia bacterium RIFOXYC2_FULL_34_12]OGS39654.1 MAG: hypothetical protein A2551_05260 [Elusimicrobia bacterium RIFOXYD2_FULL_34_30]HAM39078.1 hypothetical protein [Elusimicrobiota bacterium]